MQEVNRKPKSIREETFEHNLDFMIINDYVNRDEFWFLKPKKRGNKSI